MSQLYKSPEVKSKLRAVTERMRDEIPGEKTDHYIQTSFGDTYVLEMADPSQETLVLLHGAMTNHAVILSVMRHLVGRYHLIIPDLPGHAGWSTEKHLDPMGDDYGRWLLEVLDEFKISRCHFMGLSYGCFVANRLIAIAPERVNRAFFMVPAGFILLSAWAVIKHFLLWVILLGITGKDRFFYRIIDAVFTERPEGTMVEFFRLTMTGMKPVSGKHKLVDPNETRGFSRPLYILGCEHDFAVDPRVLPQRAAAAYPGAQVEILPGSKHTPPLDDTTLRKLADKVSGFLSAERPVVQGGQASSESHAE